MILITGGSYQGKLEYAKARFGLTDADICVNDIDFNKKCLAYIDRYALDAIKRGIEPADIFKENADKLSDKIIITTDISSGIVPMDATLRAWREACGRMNSFLAARADEVWRLFCGIPERIK